MWFTGLPSSGKTTTALALADAVRDRGARVEVLDGDEVRTHLSAGLGFTRADRDTQVTRVGYVAQLLARNGVLVLVPVIAPYAQARGQVREHHRASGTPYVEVHVCTSLDVCARRDAKGLYAKAARGELPALTGVDDPYEAPTDPDARIDTGELAVPDSVRVLLDLLSARRLL